MTVELPRTLVTLSLQPIGHDGSPSFNVDASGLRECLQNIIEALANPMADQSKVIEGLDVRLHDVEQLVKQQKNATESLRANMNLLDSQVAETTTLVSGALEEKQSTEAVIDSDDAVHMEELEAAAVKIQATFRGKSARRKTSEMRNSNVAQAKPQTEHASVGVNFQQLQSIVKTEIEARLLDVDVLQLQKSVRESMKAIESLKNIGAQQRSEWVAMKSGFEVVHAETEKHGRLIGNTSVLQLATQVHNLIKQQENDDLEQANDERRLQTLESHGDMVDTQILELKRQVVTCTEHLDDHLARLKSHQDQHAKRASLVEEHSAQLNQHLERLNALTAEVTKMSETVDSTGMKMQGMFDLVQRALEEAAEQRASLEKSASEFQHSIEQQMDELRKASQTIHEKVDRTEMQAAKDKIARLIQNQMRIDVLEEFLRGALAKIDHKFEALFSILDRQTQETGTSVLIGTRPLRRCLSCQPLHDKVVDRDDVDEKARSRLVAKVSKAIQQHQYISETHGVAVKLPQFRNAMEEQQDANAFDYPDSKHSQKASVSSEKRRPLSAPRLGRQRTTASLPVCHLEPWQKVQ